MLILAQKPSQKPAQKIEGNMTRLIRLSVVAFLSLLLASCGFHLRGTMGAVLDVDRVQVVGSEPELIDELEDTLKSIGVSLDEVDPEYVITIIGESLSRRAVATSGSITVSEYEVQMRGVFSIADASGATLISASEIRAERVYSFDPTNFVSNEEEEELLVEEMRQDVAGQIVRRFSATLRNQTSSSTSIESPDESRVESESSDK